MARAGLLDHRKFQRLVHKLQEPIPHVVGYLECLWAMSYQQRCDKIGDTIDVELSAKFPNTPGTLTEALHEVGFIECHNGVYYVHDLSDHAPQYVKRSLKIMSPGQPEDSQKLTSGYPEDSQSVASGRQGKGREEEVKGSEEKEKANTPPRPAKTSQSVTPRMHPEPKTSADLAQLFAATYTGTNRDMKNPVLTEPFFAELLRRGKMPAEIAGWISHPSRSWNESTAQFEISGKFATSFSESKYAKPGGHLGAGRIAVDQAALDQNARRRAAQAARSAGAEPQAISAESGP